jgi:hypothetical protein
MRPCICPSVRRDGSTRSSGSGLFVGKQFEIDPVPCLVDLQHGDPDDIPELIDFSAYLTAQTMMACIVEKMISRYLPDGDGAADKKLQQFDEEERSLTRR